MTKTAVTKRTKKPAGEPAAANMDAQATTFTRRPGEVVVRSTVDRVLFASDPAMYDGNPYNRPAHVLYPGVVYVLPRSAATGPDGRLALKSGELEVVDTEAGELPTTVNMCDSHARVTIRDGKPPVPDRQSWIRHWTGIVSGERSLAECLYHLINELGMSQDEVIADLTTVYRNSFLLRTASEKPWIARAKEIEVLWLAANQNGNGHQSKEEV